MISLVAWLVLSQTTAILLALGEDADLSREAGVYMLGLQWALLPSLLFFAAPLAVRRSQPSAPDADRRSGRRRLQRVRGLCAGVRQVRPAGARRVRVRVRDVAFGDHDVSEPDGRLGARPAHAQASALRPALAPRADGMARLVAARPADRRGSARGSRRLLRGFAGRRPARTGAACRPHRRSADRLPLVHGSPRPRSGGVGARRLRLRRAGSARDRPRRLVGLRPDGRLSPRSRPRR